MTGSNPASAAPHRNELPYIHKCLLQISACDQALDLRHLT
jgi:hypothetical protein